MALPRKITITGVMQETKEITMEIANLKIFPICLSQWFWRQDNRSLLLLLFSLIVHAIMLGTIARTTTGMRMKALKVAVKNPFFVFTWSDVGPYYKTSHFGKGSVKNCRNKVRGRQWRQTTCLEC